MHTHEWIRIEHVDKKEKDNRGGLSCVEILPLGRISALAAEKQAFCLLRLKNELHSASQSEVLITHTDKKEKDNRKGCQWWRYSRGEDTLALRLANKLADLRAEYAHTACGILPGEEKKLKSSSESAIRRNRIPSGNTPFCYAE